MHWKTKAIIQNTISKLPLSMSYVLYYWVQRHFGGLKKPMNPVSRLKAGINTWLRLKETGFDPVGKVFLEVGTGRIPLAPIAYWIMGAHRTITIDLNPYMKMELLKESLEYLSLYRDDLTGMFGPLVYKERLHQLIQFFQTGSSCLHSILEYCGISYVAPGDASNTGLARGSVDIHTSYNVFEHIPRNTLKAILEEATRVISKDGVLIHRIDYSDHFSHSDKEISAVNFLQFNELQWDRYAGNPYMYMNRLRHDDFLSLFESVGQKIILEEPDTDDDIIQLIRENIIQLNEKYQQKSERILSITGAWIVSRNTHSDISHVSVEQPSPLYSLNSRPSL